VIFCPRLPWQFTSWNATLVHIQRKHFKGQSGDLHKINKKTYLNVYLFLMAFVVSGHCLTKLPMRRFLPGLLLPMIFLGLLPVQATGQDPVFSQFFAAPVYMNPAFAGSTSCSRIGINYQHRQYGAETFPTAFLSFDTYAEALSGGVALSATTDHPSSYFMRSSVNGIYAYHLQATGEFSINFGIQAGYIRNDVTWGRLEFADPGEPPPENNQAHAIDFATGILAFTERFYGGVAAHHLNRPNMSLYNATDSRLSIKYTAHAGMYLEPDMGHIHRSTRTYFLSPNVIFQDQGEHTHVSLGMYAGAEPVMAGIWYRQWVNTPLESNNNLVFLLGIQLENYRVGYSYDHSFSAYADILHAAHEISIAIQFNCDQRNIRRRILNSPTF